MKYFFYLLILASLTGCFKTAEEIKREKQVDTQLQQSSQIIADLTTQINELKGGLAQTSGQLEEIDHKTNQKTLTESQTLSDRILQLQSQIEVMQKEQATQQKQINELQKTIKSQNKYIKKVNKTLDKMGDAGPADLLQKAHKAFEKNQQKNALDLYQQVLSENKINAAQKNHVYYNVGLLYYWKKNYDEALVHFSKIYTKYPKSSFAPKSLLYIARSFKNQKKNAEASAIYEELIKNYPKSKQANKAKSEK